MRYTVGFVILVWNSEKVIEKCLNSIIELKEIKSKVVIVDNGSKDRTTYIVEHYLHKYPDTFDFIKFDRNMGTTISRNVGLNKLEVYHPDYYCILDSDTEINDKSFLIIM